MAGPWKQQTPAAFEGRSGSELCVVLADGLRQHGPTLKAGLLEDGRHLGIGQEVLIALLIPVEHDPEPIGVRGVAKDLRTLRPVLPSLCSTLGREAVPEAVKIFDFYCGQNHRSPFSGACPTASERLNYRATLPKKQVPALAVDLGRCATSEDRLRRRYGGGTRGPKVSAGRESHGHRRPPNNRRSVLEPPPHNARSIRRPSGSAVTPNGASLTRSRPERSPINAGYLAGSASVGAPGDEDDDRTIWKYGAPACLHAHIRGWVIVALSGAVPSLRRQPGEPAGRDPASATSRPCSARGRRYPAQPWPRRPPTL